MGKDKNGRGFISSSLTLILSILISTNVAAESRRNTNYEYDSAGNLIGINSIVIDGPPIVTSINPGLIRLPLTHQSFVITGSKFRDSTIQFDESIFQPLGITRINNESISIDLFFLTIPQTTAHTITISNEFGSTDVQFSVAPSLPFIFVDPDLRLNVSVGSVVDLNIGLNNPDVIDHNLNLSINDTSIATISPESASIPAGQTSTAEPVTLTVLAQGSTSLNITSDTLNDFIGTVEIGCPFNPDEIGGETTVEKIVESLNFIANVLFNRLDTDLGALNLIPLAEGLPGTEVEFITGLDQLEIVVQLFLASSSCDEGCEGGSPALLGGGLPAPPGETQADICLQTVLDVINDIRNLLTPQA